jgi:hypothetical protein
LRFFKDNAKALAAEFNNGGYLFQYFSGDFQRPIDFFLFSCKNRDGNGFVCHEDDVYDFFIHFREMIKKDHTPYYEGVLI